MPINLANVNISLQQFQKISSGKYNAGEVKLADESTLEKMNNHVHLTGQNIEAISHREVLAIKEAPRSSAFRRKRSAPWTFR
jgi:hypothetical protein